MNPEQLSWRENEAARLRVLIIVQPRHSYHQTQDVPEVQAMRISRMFLFALTCAPLLSACAGIKTYVAQAESERQTCAQTEGYPDCAEGYHVKTRYQ